MGNSLPKDSDTSEKRDRKSQESKSSETNQTKSNVTTSKERDNKKSPKLKKILKKPKSPSPFIPSPAKQQNAELQKEGKITSEPPESKRFLIQDIEGFKSYETSTDGPYKRPEDVFHEKQLKILLPIGRGSFGSVFRATDVKTSKMYAVKRIDIKKKSKTSNNQLKNLSKLSQVKQKYVVRVEDVFIIDKALYIQMDFYRFRLIDEIAKNDGLPEAVCRRYFAQIIAAFKYMHGLSIAHLDFKVENVFLQPSAKEDGSYNVKISNFGLALSHFKEKDKIMRILPETKTVRFYPPEVLRVELRQTLSSVELLELDHFAIDVWSLGVSLYLMAVNRMPFNPGDWRVMFEEEMEQRFFIPEKIADNKDLVKLLKGMLEPDSTKRLTISAIVIYDQWLKKELKNLFKQDAE